MHHLFSQKLRSYYRNSDFYPVFNFSEELARGRTYLVLSSIVANIVVVLTTGVFYTGFLLENNINIVDIGIVGFIPFLSAAFAIFAPKIFERLPRRKLLLLLGRGVYYFFLIAAITALPYLGLPKSWKIPMLMAFMFIAHICNAITSSGFFVWHKKLLPNQVRPSYFSFTLAVTGIINALSLLFSSFLADFFTASGQALFGMVLIRIIALFFAVVDLLLLARIKEYPYDAQKKSTKIADIFRLPLKEKRFLLSMLVIMCWNLMVYLTVSCANVYLIDTVKISYTFINAMGALYALFLLFLTPVWQRIYGRLELFKTLRLAVLILAPLYLVYGFVTAENYFWLYPLMILCFHVGNVGLNMTFSNIPYIHMPQENETCYSSFYIVVSNLTAFIGQMLGTLFIGATEQYALEIGGFIFTNVQMLLIIQGLLMFLFAYLIHRLAPVLQQEE